MTVCKNVVVRHTGHPVYVYMWLQILLRYPNVCVQEFCMRRYLHGLEIAATIVYICVCVYVCARPWPSTSSVHGDHTSNCAKGAPLYPFYISTRYPKCPTLYHHHNLLLVGDCHFYCSLVCSFGAHGKKIHTYTRHCQTMPVTNSKLLFQNLYTPPNFHTKYPYESDDQLKNIII